MTTTYSLFNVTSELEMLREMEQTWKLVCVDNYGFKKTFFSHNSRLLTVSLSAVRIFFIS